MSAPRYATYKDSGVAWLGKVPTEWNVLPLKAVATCNDEVLPEVTDGDTVIEYVEISGVEEGRGITQTETLTFGSAPSRARRVVKHGDVLISTVRTYLRAIASVSHPAGNLIASTGFAAIRPRRVHPGYLGYLLHCEYLISEVIARSVGISYPAINASDLMGLKGPIPTIAEQQAIATFLDRETSKIDALVEEQKRLIELLKEKRQAVISQAVTKGLDPNVQMKDSGNQWIGRVPVHWTLMRLKHAAARGKNAFVDGPFGSNLKSEHFVDDGDVYVIESGFATQGRLEAGDLKTISAEHFATISRSETRGGDIIIAKIGAQFGKSSILPVLDKPAVVSGNSLKLTVNAQAFDVNFVNWHLVNLKALGVMDDIVNATAQPALSLREMNSLPLVGPPVAEQQAIVAFLVARLGDLNGLMQEAQRGIELLLERRSALISAAVTGKIDVRGLVPQPEAVAA